MYPQELLYTKDHEWIRVDESTGTIGITDYAQKELGDVEQGFRAADVVVEREVKGDWLVQSGGGCVVALDPTLDATLKQEGLAREVVNRIQRLRKEAGYDYATRIVVSISGASDVLEAVRAQTGFIAGETLARRVEIGSDLASPDLSQQVGEAGGSLSAPRGAVVFGWRWKTSISPPPQRWGEAGGSLSRGSPVRTGAASTKSRRPSTTG